MNTLTRRHLLQTGFGLAGLSLSGFLPALAEACAAESGQRRHCILLWMPGGPSQMDTFDLKPGRANGGEFKEIETSVPGVRISEHLPQLAQQAEHLAIVRSLSTAEGDHNRGTRLMNTGRQPSPLVEYPSIGSVLAFQYSQDPDALKTMDLPQFISVNGPQIGPGFLGMKYASFDVQNPGQPPENVSPPAGVAADRMARRKVMFDALESGLKTNVPAVVLGDRLAHRMPTRFVHAVAAAILATLGVATLAGAGARFGF